MRRREAAKSAVVWEDRNGHVKLERGQYAYYDTDGTFMRGEEAWGNPRRLAKKGYFARQLVNVKRSPKRARRRMAQSDGGGLMADFVGRFLQVYSQFFLLHWQTSRYARHIAFGEANDDLEEFMDEFVEAWQGKYGRVSVNPSSGRARVELGDLAAFDEIGFIVEYRDFLRDEMPAALNSETDGDLQNILDEMVARLNKLLYLLTLE